jgi:two-component system, chemotaxis family, chemotaxis protein CheY
MTLDVHLHRWREVIPKVGEKAADLSGWHPSSERGVHELCLDRCHWTNTMHKIRALIVDDSSVMRKIVERCLRQAGIELEQVLEAGNGAEGLGALRDGHVDLILCDINMPVMDGLEFVKQLQSVENAKGVPVVMITTEGSESHVVQALSAGAKGYIRKPFTPDQVKEHVIPVLEKRA